MFVKSGRVSPADGPNPAADQQWRLAIDICVAACRIYSAARIRCAVDTFVQPTTLLLWNGLRELRVGIVVLSPSVEVAVQRNAERMRQTGWGVPEWQVRANHTAMGAWSSRPGVMTLDNSALTLSQALDAIDAWEGNETVAPKHWSL